MKKKLNDNKDNAESNIRERAINKINYIDIYEMAFNNLRKKYLSKYIEFVNESTFPYEDDELDLLRQKVRRLSL